MLKHCLVFINLLYTIKIEKYIRKNHGYEDRKIFPQTTKKFRETTPTDGNFKTTFWFFENRFGPNMGQLPNLLAAFFELLLIPTSRILWSM